VNHILRAAFGGADPESAKNTVNLSVLFALLGSAHKKAACRTLIKLTPSSESVHQWFSTFFSWRHSKQQENNLEAHSRVKLDQNYENNIRLHLL